MNDIDKNFLDIKNTTLELENSIKEQELKLTSTINNDEEALNIIFKLKEDQNISLGGSSGINIGGAIRLAKKLGPGHNIITILCDPGKRYASKIYNKQFKSNFINSILKTQLVFRKKNLLEQENN